MSYEYAGSLFDNVTQAKRASVAKFLRADSPQHAAGLEMDNAEQVNALAREMADMKWDIPGEGAVSEDRARTLILDWRDEQ